MNVTPPFQDDHVGRMPGLRRGQGGLMDEAVTGEVRVKG